MILKKDNDTNILYKIKPSMWIGLIKYADFSSCYINFNGFFTRLHKTLGRNRYYL